MCWPAWWCVARCCAGSGWRSIGTGSCSSAGPNQGRTGTLSPLLAVVKNANRQYSIYKDQMAFLFKWWGTFFYCINLENLFYFDSISTVHCHFKNRILKDSQKAPFDNFFFKFDNHYTLMFNICTSRWLNRYSIIRYVLLYFIFLTPKNIKKY